MANIYQRQLKDYGKSMEYHIKSIEASIGANGYHHNASFDSFDKAQNMYSVCSSFETRIYNLNVNKDGYCKTFEDDLKLYTLWYNVQNALAEKYGDGYLQSLYKYNYNANREFDIKNNGRPRPHLIRDDLDWRGKMIYDKVFLSILYNRINEAWGAYQELCRHIGYVEVVPYTISIANSLAINGYYDHAIYLLNANIYNIPLDAGIDALRSTAEKMFVEIAYIADEYNKIYTAIDALSIIESEFLEEYNNSDQVACWYDSQTIVNALSLLIEIYMNTNYQKGIKYAKMMEDIVSNNIVGKNGIPLSNARISDVYNTLSIATTDYNEKERFLLEAIKYSPQWSYVYNINLAYTYNESGKYDKADVLLPKIVEYAQNNFLIDSWQKMILECTTLNAIWKKDSSKAKVESKKRLDTIIKMYLQKSQMLTNSSRAALWDYSFGSTLQWFSMVDLLNDRDATVSYDAALFHKNILLTQHSMIDKNIRTSSDEELKIAHNKYLDAIKRQTDSIEMCESQMMYLYSKHPEFVDNFKPAKWQDVQSCLGKKDVAIEFALTEESPMSKPKFVALLLSHDAPNPIVVPLCDEEQLRNAITNNTNTTGYLNLYDKPILYELIWQPLEQCLKGVKNIYFAPYDVLNNINFSAIKIGNTKKRLMDVYKLHRLSSTAQLYNGFAENKLCNVVAFGGVDYNNYQDTITKHATSAIPTAKKEDESFSDMRGYVEAWNILYGAESEVKNIRHILSKSNVSTQIYTYTNASEENFKKMSGDSISIVHLATHGFYFTPNDAKKMIFFNNPREDMPKNMDSGARSGLILSGGNLAWKGEVVAGKEDGVLTSKEILGMDLSSIDLMVLSACQTALGDIRNDGVYGMQRNLKMAGANTMIMSLWKVDDAATELMMKTFYENLLSGKSKRESFALAQQVVRESKNYSNPYYWAGFIMLD